MSGKIIFDKIRQNLVVKDDEFDRLYPMGIRQLSSRHWTPVEVAILAARYLAHQPGVKVLDIGSGCGKFCHIAAALTTSSIYGVEQRDSLVKIAQNVAEKHSLKNISFIRSNITTVNFKEYDSFYFFNPFIENINRSAIIDNSIHLERELFFQYSEYVKNQLSMMAEGTRIVTYWSLLNEIPAGFNLEFSLFNGQLNFWKKDKATSLDIFA
ncbi:methyltransferase domain-containing protein [Flavobacterium rakeshii]|uniref:methyltransferase domain-containing protein n=1 Tax=Flavobacterium rakeshii TaxID=1038845 RepID=UPI002E7B769A|nr:methyltransferase domain-containing protein [Flavobacterium rakeshii]MEE1896957.1 methyltransferase domain-containing protein [Flavobacterium rakeshii]